jgi:hypothetical protein
MPAKHYQSASVTGVISSTVLDTGIESTQAETKHVSAVWVYVTGHIGNFVEVWLEQERLAKIPDYFFITEETTGAANVQKATNRLTKITLDVQLPVGQKLQVAMNCGATAKNLSGCYEYEIAGT